MADKFDSGADTPGAAAVRRVIADPRRLFTILLILGSIAISIGRAFEFLHVLFAIVFPVACILGYAAINVFSQHANSSRSQTADNCYFLGFLYFLVSLAATLMFLQAERISVGEVVRGFGTALITTIAGLATRIYLLQGGANLSENRERAEFELAQAVQRFKDQLVATTDLLNASQQVSSELLQSVVVSTSDALAESANACKVTLQEGEGTGGSSGEGTRFPLADRARRHTADQGSHGQGQALRRQGRRIRRLLAGQQRPYSIYVQYHAACRRYCSRARMAR